MRGSSYFIDSRLGSVFGSRHERNLDRRIVVLENLTRMCVRHQRALEKT